MFPLGTTQVSCSVSDSHGNIATPTFTVSVVDTSGPVVTASADVVVEASGSAGASATFPPATAVDAVDGPHPATCDAASGTVYPVGVTTVHCIASDSSGHVGSDTFTITVTDTTKPIVTVPLDLLIEPTGSTGAVVEFDPATADDLVDGPLEAECDPLSGALFPLGTTTVACTAVDDHGNVGTASFTITVQDRTAPLVSPPADLTVEASGATGAVVAYPAGSALDVVGGTLAIDCLPASGSLFPLGDTTVTCTATDAAGNPGTAVFVVQVLDRTAPSVATVPDVTEEATSASGAVVVFTAPGATDAVDPSVAIVCDRASGSVFALGDTLVTCTATDDAGNHAASTFTVTVEDTTDPELTVPGDLLRGGTSAAGAVVTFAVAATDLVDGTVAVDCTPASGSLFVRTPTLVECEARDAAGNLSTASFMVTVRGMALIAAASPGDTELFVASNDGFAPGDYVAIGIEGPDPEIRKIDALGSIIVGAPIAETHLAGSIVELISPAPADVLAPQITIGSPVAGGSFAQGSAPRADFACLDAGVGLETCEGTVPDGGVLDTAAIGTHSFTVRAWDENGNLSTLSVDYAVVRAGWAGVLPYTGSEVWIVVLIAGVLLMTGLALVLLRRLRRPVVPRSLLRSRD